MAIAARSNLRSLLHLSWCASTIVFLLAMSNLWAEYSSIDEQKSNWCRRISKVFTLTPDFQDILIGTDWRVLSPTRHDPIKIE
jgi:hypothetical protein